MEKQGSVVSKRKLRGALDGRSGKKFNVDIKDAELATKLSSLGKEISELKKGNGNWVNDKTITDKVWDLLALKQRVPEWVETYGWPEFRIRWRVLNSPQGKAQRFQIKATGISFTGDEILKLIEGYTKNTFKKHGFNGGVMKIERIERSGDKDSVFKAVEPEDVFKAPLQFPGPILEPNPNLEFRVTVVGKPYHFNTPESFKAGIPETIDAGVNLFNKEFQNVLPRVVVRGYASGVSQMVLISTNVETSQHSLMWSQRYKGSLHPIVGIHPTEVKNVKDGDLEKIEEMLKSNPGIVAVGECGLDFEKVSEDNVAAQTKIFEAQLLLAIKYKKTLFIHERKAFKETVSILEKHKEALKDIDIVINCFTGTKEQVDGYNAFNAFYTITGFICSDKRGKEFRSVLEVIPIDKLLIGTDAPYLLPFNMPRPYPKRNEPSCLPHVLDMISQCLKQNLDTLAKKIVSNTRLAFSLPTMCYAGTIYDPNSRAIIVEDVIKAEDERALAKAGKDGKVAKPPQVMLEKGQTVFCFKNRKFLCSDKEHAILEKQGKRLDEEDMHALIQDFSLKEIASNADVIPFKE